MGNIFDTAEESTFANAEEESKTKNAPKVNEKAMIDPVILRKINLLTAKKRPFCAYCNALVGFTWKNYKPTENEKEDDLSENKLIPDKIENNGEEAEMEIPAPQKSTSEYEICMPCFRKDQFPIADRDCFTDQSLSKEHWDELDKLNPGVISAESLLTSEQKSALIMAVINNSDESIDWKTISVSVGLKGPKEAKDEFFKMGESDL